MRLTRKSEYGLKGLLYLARHTGQKSVLTAEVSEAQNIPQSFLNKIFQKLAKAGILRSCRGYGGGFRLAQQPQSITLRKIIETLEGPIKLWPSDWEKEAGAMAGNGGSMALTTMWQKIQQRINKMLEKTTVFDLLKKSRERELD